VPARQSANCRRFAAVFVGFGTPLPLNTLVIDGRCPTAAGRPSMATLKARHAEPAAQPERMAEFFDTHFVPIEDQGPSPRVDLAQAMPLLVDLRTLADFKRHMAREGWPVQVARMIFDRVYAHERLAFAHTSANEALQRLALDLFRRMHAADGLAAH
jgi:hypothetical protein